MLRIYLDQNKWIDLARAAIGHPRGDRFTDALAVARAGVTAGEVSFPLDIYRYWETGKRGDSRSRNNVADAMLDLSRQHTMATPLGVLDQEIDRALQRRFGRPEHPRQQQVFGIGMRHIGEGHIDWPELDLSVAPDGGASTPGGLRALLQNAISDFVEEQLLRTGPDAFRAAGFEPGSAEHGHRFVEWENSVAETIRNKGYKGDQVNLAMRASDLSDILPAVLAGLDRIGITWEEFFDSRGARGLYDFMDDLPTRYVTNVMRSAKHRQTQQKWEPNDFIDIVALPVATVYCDVLITEKQWAHRLRQAKVDERYDTRVLSDTADLVDVLVSDSSTS